MIELMLNCVPDGDDFPERLSSEVVATVKALLSAHDACVAGRPTGLPRDIAMLVRDVDPDDFDVELVPQPGGRTMLRVS